MNHAEFKYCRKTNEPSKLRYFKRSISLSRINQIWHQASLVNGFWIVQLKGPISEWDVMEIAKIHWRIFKILCRTMRPISTKVGTKHFLVTGIQVSSNEGPCLLPRGNIRNTGNTLTKFKRIGQFQACKLDLTHPYVKGTEIFIIKRLIVWFSFQKEDNDFY